MLFTWDTNKEQINIKKHGIDFKTALRIFSDENRLEIYDDEHSVSEERYKTIGLLKTSAIVLTVIYSLRADTYRIISARKATNKEVRSYYANL